MQKYKFFYVNSNYMKKKRKNKPFYRLFLCFKPTGIHYIVRGNPVNFARKR